MNLLTATPARLWVTLRTWPTWRGWLETALTPLILVAIGVAALFVYSIQGGSFGVVIHGKPPPATLVIALITFFAPALGEEIVFRGALTPSKAEVRSEWLAILPGLVLFILWHVVEAFTIRREYAAIFLAPWFLASAGVLGLACAILRRRTGSLWPAVFIHWLVVFIWKAGMDGPVSPFPAPP